MIGAGNETQTRDPDLGKVVLYQLSYSRIGISLTYFGASNEIRARYRDLGKHSTCATNEVTPALHIGAGNETRTRDPDLGKVVLYQLSYSRNMDCLEAVLMIGAGNETRTRDPDLGKVVLYQLSYSRIGTSSANILERETRLELATPTLARSCSTN